MDTLATIITLLKPAAVGTKIIHGGGRWCVRYPKFGHPSFALVLEGSCKLAAEGMPVMTLGAGDFVLFPAMPGFLMGSDLKCRPRAMKADPAATVEEIFHGDEEEEPSVRMLGGYFAFDPVNAAVLLDFLPKVMRIRASGPAGESVAALAGMIQREAREKRAGRALVLTRLIEVMLVEALRSAPADAAEMGLLAGLRDPQLGVALRGIHVRMAEPWTVATLAREAGMSRSSFAERFAGVVGMSPLNYLLQWRLAVAKSLLREGKTVAEVAMTVGYESASGFSTAFSRETGVAPRGFADGESGALRRGLIFT